MYLGSRYHRPWMRRHVDSPRQNAGGGHSSSPFSLFVFDCHTSGTRHQTVNATSEGGVGLELQEIQLVTVVPETARNGLGFQLGPGPRPV